MSAVISSGKRTGFLHSWLLTGAVALFAFLLALLFGIKLWIAVVGVVLILLVTVGFQHISANTSSENHTTVATNVTLVLATMAFVMAAPDSLKQHSAAEPKGVASGGTAPTGQADTLAASIPIQHLESQVHRALALAEVHADNGQPGMVKDIVWEGLDELERFRGDKRVDDLASRLRECLKDAEQQVPRACEP